MKQWELKPEWTYDDFQSAICPCCGVGKFEFIMHANTGIKVNIESEGTVPIERFWEPIQICDNPMCKWSKVNHK